MEEKTKTTDDKWTIERSLKLIEEYRRRPVLWDKKDPLFNNKTFLDEAWLDISNIMDIDQNSCIQHMSDLYFQFQSEKARVLSKNGAKTEWFAWNAMAFLEFAAYEKLKLVTGNYFYSEKLEEEKKQFQQKYVPKKSEDIEGLEGLDEDLKTFVIGLGTKMKNYPAELRTRIKETIIDVLNIADEECAKPNHIDLTDD